MTVLLSVCFPDTDDAKMNEARQLNPGRNGHVTSESPITGYPTHLLIIFYYHYYFVVFMLEKGLKEREAELQDEN